MMAGNESAGDEEDVSGILLGEPRAREKAIFWEWRFSTTNLRPVDKSPMLAIRLANWKLLLNPDGSRVELYDVVADPGESQNLADVNPDVTADLSAQALAWAASLPAGPVSPAAGDNAYPWP